MKNCLFIEKADLTVMLTLGVAILSLLGNHHHHSGQGLFWLGKNCGVMLYLSLYCHDHRSIESKFWFTAERVKIILHNELGISTELCDASTRVVKTLHWHHYILHWLHPILCPTLHSPTVLTGQFSTLTLHSVWIYICFLNE